MPAVGQLRARRVPARSDSPDDVVVPEVAVVERGVGQVEGHAGSLQPEDRVELVGVDPRASSEIDGCGAADAATPAKTSANDRRDLGEGNGSRLPGLLSRKAAANLSQPSDRQGVLNLEIAHMSSDI